MIFIFLRNRRARAEQYVAAQRKRRARFYGWCIDQFEYMHAREPDMFGRIEATCQINLAQFRASRDGVTPIRRGIIDSKVMAAYSSLPIRRCA